MPSAPSRLVAATLASCLVLCGAAAVAAAAEGLASEPGPLYGWLRWTTRGIEIVGIGIIVLGAAAASLAFAWRALRAGGAGGGLYEAYRANLGRAILLGLEFLVAADIIGTVAVEPTLRSLAVLAGIVLIRTFLSFSLEVEIEGRWPWQRGRRSDPPSSNA